MDRDFLFYTTASLQGAVTTWQSPISRADQYVEDCHAIARNDVWESSGYEFAALIIFLTLSALLTSIIYSSPWLSLSRI